MAERSPNYPAYPLARAVEWSRNLHKSDKRNVVPIETVAKATGSEATKGISGPARQKVATMRQYGLIDTAAHGQYRLSPLGFDLALHAPDDAEYKAAIRSAALTPPLFAEVYNRYEELPSDHTLRIALQKGQFGADFSEDGAKRFIRAFNETLAFANLDKERYTDSEGSGTGDSTELKLSQYQDFRQFTGSSSRIRPPEGKVAVSLVLPPGVTAQITFSGNKPTRRTIEKLVAHLNLMKDDFDEPDTAAMPDREPERLRDLEASDVE